jgi:hypothetical protein
MKFWGWQMGRRLTVTLAIALLVFVLASMARADTVTSPYGYTFTIPDGSVVTSFFNSRGLIFGVDFSFPDGSGLVQRELGIGEFGQIDFAIPVTNLKLIGFLGAGGPGEQELSASSPTGFTFALCDNPIPTECEGPFDVTLSGPVSQVTFDSFSQAAVTSMSYTVPTVPEPTTLFLTSLGLGCVLFWRKRIIV